MKFVVLALCLYAVSSATLNNRNFVFKPWQTAEVQNVQTGNFARATAQISAPVPKTVKEPVVPVVDITKTIVQPVNQVFTSVVKEVSPVVQSKFSSPVVPIAKVPTYVSTNVDASKDTKAEVVRSDADVSPVGFQYSYETSNGISAASSGEIKTVDQGVALTVRGQYQYYSPEGVPITVTYVADENGFQPQSNVLPVAPPVPVAIARALEYLRSHPPKEVKNF